MNTPLALNCHALSEDQISTLISSIDAFIRPPAGRQPNICKAMGVDSTDVLRFLLGFDNPTPTVIRFGEAIYKKTLGIDSDTTDIWTKPNWAPINAATNPGVDTRILDTDFMMSLWPARNGWESLLAVPNMMTKANSGQLKDIELFRIEVTLMALGFPDASQFFTSK